MPSRIVREGIISSPRINALSPGAELFYRRLMSVVDDFGRTHGSVVTLRGACWPTNPERISEKEVGKWLNELLRGEAPLVKAYSVEGASYLEIQDFGQQTRTKSKFPAPPWKQSDIRLKTENNQSENKPLVNDGTSRSRISESKSKSEAGVDDRKLTAVPAKRPEGAPDYEVINEAWKWYCNEYPTEVNTFMETQLFISVMETARDLADLKENLPVYKLTKRWMDGFPPSSENFLSKRIFKVSPKSRDSPNSAQKPQKFFDSSYITDMTEPDGAEAE